MMNTPDCTQLLEIICSQGCIYVNSVIELLESGQPAAQIQHLSPAEKSLLLIELKSIMAVYNQPKTSQ